jgi:hypothetical protein
MIKRREAACRIGYAALGALLVATWVTIAPAKIRPVDLSKYNFKRALTVTMTYVPDGLFDDRAVYFRHICCDCSSTHDVVMFIRDDEVEQNWLTNRFETDKRRRLRGIVVRDPIGDFTAEHGMPRDR